MRVVPKTDGRFRSIVLVGQCAQACGAEQKIPCALRSQAEPTRGEHPQKVTAREQQHCPLNRPDALHYAIRSRADLIERFAAGETVAEYLPIGALGANVCSCEAFVIAVVPFDQVAINVSLRAESRQFARARGALEGAGPDACEFHALEALAQAAGVTFSASGQWQVGSPGVLSTDRPGGLTMSGQVNYWQSVQSFLPVGSTAPLIPEESREYRIVGRQQNRSRKALFELSPCFRRDRGIAFFLGFLVVLTTIVLSIVPLSRAGRLAFLAFALTLIVGSLTTIRHRVLIWLVAALTITTFVVDLWAEFVSPRSFMELDTALKLVWLSILVLITLVRMLRPGPVTVYRVMGGIAAYSSLAFTWTFAYQLIVEQIPGAIHFESGTADTASLQPGLLTSFSFITLTTLAMAMCIRCTPRCDRWRLRKPSWSNHISPP
jgi:hypothetical protein